MGSLRLTRKLLQSAVCVALAALSGCAGMPTAGPTAAEIVAQEAPPEAITGYVVVDIDARVAGIVGRRRNSSLVGMFKDGRTSADVRIGYGDTVTVTIWEAGSGGLFSTASLGGGVAATGSRTITLPEQEVDKAGTIQVPYAGRIKLAGLRPAEAEAKVVAGLQGKAIEPQAIVTITKNRSTTITVTGEVTNGLLVPVTAKGDRVLDVIAAAGGIRAPSYESFVRLTRGERTASVPFNTLLADARENIYVRPGDVLTVVRQPQRFTAFGGTGRNELVPFDAAGMTLEEALARVGGLLDFRADPTGVFLLRFEPASLVAELAPERQGQIDTPFVPVVYRLNLRNANSYFMARSFPMRDKDIVYVANAPMTEVDKFLIMVGRVTGPVIAGAALATR